MLVESHELGCSSQVFPVISLFLAQGWAEKALGAWAGPVQVKNSLQISLFSGKWTRMPTSYRPEQLLHGGANAISREFGNSVLPTDRVGDEMNVSSSDPR